MAYSPDFTDSPDPAQLHVMGLHVFHDHIAVGPADADRLRALSATYAEAAVVLTAVTATAHNGDAVAAAEAEIVVSDWWARATALAASEIDAGRLETGNAVVADGYAFGSSVDTDESAFVEPVDPTPSIDAITKMDMWINPMFTAEHQASMHAEATAVLSALTDGGSE